MKGKVKLKSDVMPIAFIPLPKKVLTPSHSPGFLTSHGFLPKEADTRELVHYPQLSPEDMVALLFQRGRSSRQNLKSLGYITALLVIGSKVTSSRLSPLFSS